MKDNFALLETLDRLFGGARESILSSMSSLRIRGRSFGSPSPPST
jgi:hypothetical protein